MSPSKGVWVEETRAVQAQGAKLRPSLRLMTWGVRLMNIMIKTPCPLGGDSLVVTLILRQNRLVFLNNLGIIFSLHKCP
jgi:hypothetical protein